MGIWKKARTAHSIVVGASAWDAVFGVLSALTAAGTWLYRLGATNVTWLLDAAILLLSPILIFAAVYFFNRTLPTRRDQTTDVASIDSSVVGGSASIDTPLPKTRPWGSLTLSPPAFVIEKLPQGSGVHALPARLETQRVVQITRIVLLFKSLSRAGSFEISDVPLPKRLASGEIVGFDVLHFEPRAGTRFGRWAAVPQANALDILRRDNLVPSAANWLSVSGSFACRLAISADGEDDLTHDFTVYTGSNTDTPLIIDPVWHRPYDDADPAAPS